MISHGADSDMIDPASAEPKAKRRTGATLFILGGYHAGSSVMLDGDDAVQIGAGDDDDVILSDPGLAGCHATLKMSRGGRACEIEASGGAVEMDDGRRLEPGEIASFALPGRITLIGGPSARVELFFDAASIARDLRGRRAVQTRTKDVVGFLAGKRQRRVVATGAAATVLGVAMSFALAHNSQETELQKTAIQMPAAAASQQAVESEAQKIDDVVTALRAKMDAAGLTALSVSATKDFVTVEGVLLPRQKSAWMAVRRWYDREHASNFMIVAELTAGSAAQSLPKRPSGVWLGANPYIVDAAGQRRVVGSTTSDGWRIVAIDRSGVVVRKNAQEMTLSFD